jgi:hypothetical protein
MDLFCQVYKEVIDYIEYDKFIGDINDRIIKILDPTQHFNVYGYNSLLFINISWTYFEIGQNNNILYCSIGSFTSINISKYVLYSHIHKFPKDIIPKYCIYISHAFVNYNTIMSLRYLIYLASLITCKNVMYLCALISNNNNHTYVYISYNYLQYAKIEYVGRFTIVVNGLKIVDNVNSLLTINGWLETTYIRNL